MGAGPRQTDLRSKAVSPDRWRDPGLLFRRDSESSVSSYHSTPTNGSPQIRPTILEAMNLPLTPYPDSNAASSLLSPLPEVPDTPSSTLGQFGDLARKPNPSAAELVQKVHKSWRSQSREGHSRTQDSHSRTRFGRHQSQSRSRSEQRDVHDPPETRETLESRQRSLSRSTAKASIDPRDERESSLSRSSNHASVKDRHREREKERERERDRERDTDRSQTSSHRRAASSKELRLLAHERNYDNEREIAATKVSMYLQSMAAQTPQPMPSPPQSNASQTPQPQSSQTPKPTAPPVQQIPSRAAVDTPIPAASHTPIPAGSHTPIPSVSAMSFTSESDRELLQENRGLYQRVAALQRTERDLLAENQELVRQLAVFKKHHETRHQQWKDEYQKIKEREKILLVEAQQLKQKIMRQEEQILDLAVANAQIENPAPGLSDRQITTWFAERDESWFLWARNFASHDPNRLSSGLHPLQLYEVCDGIKSFVKLTDDFKLPAELLVKGTDMIQAVLHGMLVNFICTETLSSPFWIFNAISSGSPESPFVAPATAISPGGFRLDLAMLNAIPSRTFPAAPVPTLQPHRDPRFPPPLITSNLQPGGMLSASSLAYPMKDEMENMFHMLTKAQTGEAGLTSVQLREAQLVQLFAESGMSIKSPQDAGGVEAKRMLIESRLNYARRLKERFLSGAARFLLQDQDPAGIANLERTLTDHIDDALRFSCQLWARPGPIRFHGFTALGGRQFKPSDRLMSLCHAQSPKAPVASVLPAHLLGLGLSQAGPETPGPPGYYDRRPVVMVVQPAIEAIEVGGGGVGGRDDDPSKPRKISKVWLKARVLVAASSQEQTPSAPTTTNIGTTKVTMMTSPDPQATTPPESEKAFLIGPVPKSAVRASPKRTPSEQQGQFPAQVASYYTASLGHAIDSQSAPLEKMAGGISSLQQETALRTS